MGDESRSVRGGEELGNVRPEATVANLQRMSTDDGPGIRTTVFFKGCSLSCTWCHNPECMSAGPQLVWHRVRCISCGVCSAVCPSQAVVAGPEGIVIDRQRCVACGTCAEACPSTALELIGKRWEVEALFDEVARDRPYFAGSGGGVTVSGGEPVLQVSFVEALLARCRAAGIHTALDTCGMCSRTALLRLVEQADMVLYDIKEIDAERHLKFAGQPNERILENLLSVKHYLEQGSKPLELWLRTPLIPGATATEANIRGIGSFIASKLGDSVSRWELCAFNNLCRDKYERLGLTWEFAGTDLLSSDAVEQFADLAKRSGVNPNIVIATGATSVEGSSPPAEEKTEAQA